MAVSNLLSFAFGFGIGGMLIFILSSLIKRAPLMHDSVEERVSFVVGRCRVHRNALRAYYDELCELHKVEPFSDKAEHLFDVVFDGAVYAGNELDG